MKVHLMTVGDELLIGQVVNTNASWMGEQLLLRGAEVARMVSVPDELEVIVDELRNASEDADLVIITGGLGPTHDDLTREAIAAFLGVSLSLDEALVTEIESRFSRRGREMPERNKVQAMVPAGCEVLSNPVGTAPGLWYEGNGFKLCALPGVPHEMKELMGKYVFPRITEDERIKPLAQRTLLTAGIGESDLQERLGDASQWLGTNQKLAYLPQIGGVRLRLMAYSESWEDAGVQLEAMEVRVRALISQFIYGTDEDLLERRIGQLLLASNSTLATAESCTGGLIGDRLTNISGASAYFKGGVIAYSNDAKHRILGVEDDLLQTHGAVSEQVAIEMAEGVRKVMSTDIGISATGIMGPSGGSIEKPVGTVWIGYADQYGAKARCIMTQKDRIRNKRYASSYALNTLWRALHRVHK